MAAPQQGALTLTFSEDELDTLIAALAALERAADFDEPEYEDEYEVDEPEGFTAQAALLLARIEAALPDEPRGPAPRARKGDGPHERVIRAAIHAETKLALAYTDKKGTPSRRVIWLLECGFFGAGDTLAAWCESRRDFRHFRLDRIQSLKNTGERIPCWRRILLAQLRLTESDGYF